MSTEEDGHVGPALGVSGSGGGEAWEDLWLP